MAKKIYVGVNNTARNVTDIYIGVNGVARKVVKGYIGVNGVAQQFWGASNPYYATEIGTSVTGWYTSGQKIVTGDCYMGVCVALKSTNVLLYWGAFCLSLSEDVVRGMTYRYGTGINVGSFTYHNQTWYYSHDQIQGSYASSTTLDNTQPPERRYYYGDLGAGEFDIVEILTSFLDSIY